MTNKELQNILSQYPDNAIVMYKHNTHGRIDVDIVLHSEEELLSGEIIQIITLEGEE